MSAAPRPTLMSAIEIPFIIILLENIRVCVCVKNQRVYLLCVRAMKQCACRLASAVFLPFVVCSE